MYSGVILNFRVWEKYLKAYYQEENKDGKCLDFYPRLS